MRRNKEKYAESIIRTTIIKLKREMPELAVAFKLLKLKPVEIPIEISTDFRHLFYNPDRVVDLKEKGQGHEIDFQIMHIILHGLLGDCVYVKNRRQPATLHLALDQRVDNMLEQLGFHSVKDRLHNSLHMMKRKKPYCTTFGNPHKSLKSKPLKKRARSVWPHIMSDQHSMWMPIYRKVMRIDEEPEDEADDIFQKWEKAANVVAGSEDKENFAKTIGQNLMKEQKKRNSGKGAGNESVVVTRAEAEAIDYREVLAQLLSYKEDPRENMDSIDPMYYYYSLDNYDDILLIEPRENEEVKSAGTICVAIDTSGSCDGIIAKAFLNELCGLVDELVSRGVKGKLLLLQCDYCIQEETEYNLSDISTEEFNKMELKGYGGTDFNPVFNRIASYMKQTGEKVDALIYLTDGDGAYPTVEPEYPTVFVLTDMWDEESLIVPKWIKTCKIDMEDAYGRYFYN